MGMCRNTRPPTLISVRVDVPPKNAQKLGELLQSGEVRISWYPLCPAWSILVAEKLSQERSGERSGTHRRGLRWAPTRPKKPHSPSQAMAIHAMQTRRLKRLKPEPSGPGPGDQNGPGLLCLGQGGCGNSPEMGRERSELFMYRSTGLPRKFEVVAGFGFECFGWLVGIGWLGLAGSGGNARKSSDVVC